VRSAKSSKSVKSAKKGAKSAKSVPDDDDDQDDEESEAESEAESVIEGKIKRSIQDRKEYYKNQSDCHAFGPHRAVCSRCKQVVNLSRREKFAVAPWEKHRSKCDQELARWVIRSL